MNNFVNCPSCGKLVPIKKNGHGKCECGARIKIVNWWLSVKKTIFLNIGMDKFIFIWQNQYKIRNRWFYEIFT